MLTNQQCARSSPTHPSSIILVCFLFLAVTTLLPLFVPLLAIIALASLGQQHHAAARITRVVLLLLSLLALLAGAAMQFAPPEVIASILPATTATALSRSGLWLIITGVLCISILFAAHRHGQDKLAGNWQHPAPLTALILALLYAGLNLSQASFLTADMLNEIDAAVGLPLLAGQNLMFVLAACLGVGWGIRRSLPQVGRRLGVTRLGLPQLARAVAMTFFLLFLSTIMGGLLMLLAPDATASAESINQLLLGAFQSPGGAVLLGLLTGIGEETLYRGALQPVFGVWLTSLIFALHHIQYLSPALILIFCLGLVLGWVRKRWGLTTAALVHAFYNTSLLLLSIAANSL